MMKSLRTLPWNGSCSNGYDLRFCCSYRYTETHYVKSRSMHVCAQIFKCWCINMHNRYSLPIFFTHTKQSHKNTSAGFEISNSSKICMNASHTEDYCVTYFTKKALLTCPGISGCVILMQLWSDKCPRSLTLQPLTFGKLSPVQGKTQSNIF